MIAGWGTLLPTRSIPSSIRWTTPRFAGTSPTVTMTAFSASSDIVPSRQYWPADSACHGHGAVKWTASSASRRAPNPVHPAVCQPASALDLRGAGDVDVGPRHVADELGEEQAPR